MKKETYEAIVNALENANFSAIYKSAIGKIPEDANEDETTDSYAVMFNVETDELFMLHYATPGNGWAETAAGQNPWRHLGYLNAVDILMNNPVEILTPQEHEF
jgi:hypothetical protein